MMSASSQQQQSSFSAQPPFDSESNNAETEKLLKSEGAAAVNSQQSRHNAVTPSLLQTTPPLETASKSNTINSSASSQSRTASDAPTALTSLPITPSKPINIEANPLNAGLRIQTDLILNYTETASGTNSHSRTGEGAGNDISRLYTKKSMTRTPSVKKIIASSVGSNSAFGSAPNSALSSPMLNAMADVTPLPSPLLSGDSPGPWRKLGAVRDSPMPITPDAALVTANGESISAAIANQSKRRAYHGLITAGQDSGLTNTHVNKEKSADGHTRNRSVSEYVPDAMQVPKIRHITVSGSHAQILDVGTPEEPKFLDTNMRREPNLAVQRGLAPMPKPPTPPSSRTGGESSDSDSSFSATLISRVNKKPRYEYYDAKSREDSKRRRWRGLKVLGQGTFSKVMLATSQIPDQNDRIEEDNTFGISSDGIPPGTEQEPKIDRRKLVAVKICEHGPKGGASEERVEMSLKRELEIMKLINHPSLVHLKAWSIEETRAILVLSYCPGGDLFEVASERRSLLVPGLLRRMFSELVGAVRYLHERHIVHRDIKLENVLVNLPPQELARPIDWTTYPYSVITLTDLGLSRFVADDEKLNTRCGSDDYAAPEVIMGSPYDGRATDAWSLGVLLYALLESRLPFDPNPGMSEGHRQRSRTSHRIARVEWRWMEFAGDEGDHEGDPEKFKAMGLLGAMLVTEGLLKRARSRWTMDKVADEDWVKGAISVEGGVQFREEESAAVVDGDELVEAELYS